MSARLPRAVTWALLGALASACEAEPVQIEKAEQPIWIPLSTTDQVTLANKYVSPQVPVTIPVLARSIASAKSTCPERVFEALPATLTQVLSGWITGESDAGVPTTLADELGAGDSPFLLYRANFDAAGVSESGGYAEQTFAMLEPLPDQDATRLTLIQVAKVRGACGHEPYDPNDGKDKGQTGPVGTCSVIVPESPAGSFLRWTLPPVDPCGEGLSLRELEEHHPLGPQ